MDSNGLRRARQSSTHIQTLGSDVRTRFAHTDKHTTSCYHGATPSFSYHIVYSCVYVCEHNDVCSPHQHKFEHTQYNNSSNSSEMSAQKNQLQISPPVHETTKIPPTCIARKKNTHTHTNNMSCAFGAYAHAFGPVKPTRIPLIHAPSHTLHIVNSIHAHAS